ncbi:MAG: helix-hairpin-helix domain-containing protein [Promethearchaeota archaeon]
MQKSLEDIKGIGKATLKRLENAGVDSIGKLASMSFEDLVKIQGIGKSTAQKYIKLAQDFMEKLKGNIEKSIPKKKKKNQEKIPEKKFQNIKLKPIKIHPIDIKNMNNNSKSIEPNAKKKINKKKNLPHPRPIVSPQKNKYDKSKTKPVKFRKTNDKAPENYIKTFFPQDVIYRVRFLHYRIKELEKLIIKDSEKIDLEYLDYIKEYVNILNINYKTQSQIKIIKELNLTPKFFDPIDNKEIQIWDIMFECARALWILARTYTLLSREYENNRKSKDAITAMFESSRIFKAAAHFTVACTRQEEIGSTLSFDNLELKSEEARIIAQSINAELEEQGGNFYLASKLYSGLSALSKRLYYSKELPQVKGNMLKAQFNYDLAKAYYLKAKANSMSPMSYEFENINRKYKQKSNYFFSKAEEIWQSTRDGFKSLTDDEIRNIDYNLSIVNQYIIENDEEIMDKEILKKIPDIEPFIAIPENISHIIPKTIQFLTKFPPKNIEFKKYKQFKDLTLEKNYLENEKKNLIFKKASLNKTIKQIKSLYRNNDLGINKFAELMEKYLEKIEILKNSIQKLETKKVELEKPKTHKKKIDIEVKT